MEMAQQNAAHEQRLKTRRDCDRRADGMRRYRIYQSGGKSRCVDLEAYTAADALVQWKSLGDPHYDRRRLRYIEPADCHVKSDDVIDTARNL